MAYTSDKRLHVNADRSKIVPENSEDAAYLLVAEGGELSDEEAAKYGLGKKNETKAELAAPENKAESMPTRNEQGSGLTINRGTGKK